MDDLTRFFNNEINEIIHTSNSYDDTVNLAFNMAQYLNKSDVIVLNGELGSGKTVFVYGIAKYFNMQTQVSSPTFTIVNEYTSEEVNLYHFDVYRLQDENQFIETIGTDYFENGICIIEWGDIIKNILPANTVFINISKIDDNTRNIQIKRGKN